MMTEEECNAARDFGLKAKELFLQYRLLATLIGLYLINTSLYRIEKNFIAKYFPLACEHLSTDAVKGISKRIVQFVCGLLVAILGYVTLLYNSASGCNVSEIYIFYIGGLICIVFDAHEFVREWPLPPYLLAHHIAVFYIVLCFAEFRTIPPNRNDPISWHITTIVANVGVFWVCELFQAVYRLASSLETMERARKLYLIVSPLRFLTCALTFYSFVDLLFGMTYGQASAAGVLAIGMSCAQYKVTLFVYRFDCKKYFLSHQATWNIKKEEEQGGEVGAEADADVEKQERDDTELTDVDCVPIRCAPLALALDPDSDADPKRRSSL